MRKKVTVNVSHTDKTCLLQGSTVRFVVLLFAMALSLALLSGTTKAETLDQDTLATKIEPAGAIATSEPNSMLVAERPHIIAPLLGGGKRWSSVTVEAYEAWSADARSTAIAASPMQEAESLLTKGGATRGWLSTASGVLREWPSTEKADG